MGSHGQYSVVNLNVMDNCWTDRLDSNGQYSVVNLNVVDTVGLVKWAQMGSTLLSI